jgi:hypothetical protein
MIKIQDAGNGYRVRVSCDENGVEQSRTPSFNKKSPLWDESEEWLKDNEILPQFTQDEIDAKAAGEAEKAKTAYIGLRKQEYPDPMEYNDAKVKQASSIPEIQAEGVAQEQKYLDDCLAVKAKYPKPEEP